MPIVPALEVLPVYEVLCEADGSDSSKLHTFKSLDLPGCLESDDAVEMLTGSVMGTRKNSL